MSRRPVISDLIDYLQQAKQGGDVVVVMSEDDVQCPGEYITLDQFFQEFEQRQQDEDAREAAAAMRLSGS